VVTPPSRPPHPTGFWAEELLSPLEVFSDAGIDVDLASPEGRTPVVDQSSLAPDTIGEEESAKQRKALDALAGRACRQGALATGVASARGRRDLLPGEAWAPFVVVDDTLVTGQNPASSTGAAQKVVELLTS